MSEKPRRGITRLVGAVVDPVVDSVDLNALLADVDLDDLLARVDLNLVLDKLDIDALLTRIDVDHIVSRVDVNGLMERVDIDALMERVDVDRIVGRVDVNGLMERVDIDGLMERVDIDALLDRASVGSVVTDSANAVATTALDLGRRQIAALDTVIVRTFDRLFGRPVLAEDEIAAIDRRPAGPVSRFVGYMLDSVFIGVLFGVGVSAVSYLLNLLLQHEFDPRHNGGIWWGLGIGVFAALYMWVSLALVGRTPGAALLGLRVVSRDGGPLGPGRAFVRTAVFPLSFILGLGFLGIVLGRDRRALHDVVGRSKVIYDWGDRTAELPDPMQQFLETRARRRAQR